MMEDFDARSEIIEVDSMPAIYYVDNFSSINGKVYGRVSLRIDNKFPVFRPAVFPTCFGKSCCA